MFNNQSDPIGRNSRCGFGHTGVLDLRIFYQIRMCASRIFADHCGNARHYRGFVDDPTSEGSRGILLPFPVECAHGGVDGLSGSLEDTL
jgi:hypothetical protein